MNYEDLPLWNKSHYLIPVSSVATTTLPPKMYKHLSRLTNEEQEVVTIINKIVNIVYILKTWHNK